jgi:hypothetical protein
VYRSATSTAWTTFCARTWSVLKIDLNYSLSKKSIFMISLDKVSIDSFSGKYTTSFGVNENVGLGAGLTNVSIKFVTNSF